jgi:hypothetical protein
MLPKLNALRILSVLKYRAHRPQSEPNGWRAMTLRRNDGRRRDRSDGNVLDRTRS